MKRLAERGSCRPPRRGYVAACVRCGLEVVHSKATNLPFPQHLNSKACAGSSSPPLPARVEMPDPLKVFIALPHRVELPDVAMALDVARVSVELRLDGTYVVHLQPFTAPDLVALEVSFANPGVLGA